MFLGFRLEGDFGSVILRQIVLGCINSLNARLKCIYHLWVFFIFTIYLTF